MHFDQAAKFLDLAFAEIRFGIGFLASLKKAAAQASEETKQLAKQGSVIFEKVALRDYDEASKNGACGTPAFQEYYVATERHFTEALQAWDRR